MLDKAKRAQEHHRKSVALAIERGIPIAMGTDAGTPFNRHGDNLHELMLINDCGMTAMQAIVAATSNAARALGWDSRIGTVEPGKLADLLVLSLNPLDDVRVLTRQEFLKMVLLGGRVVIHRDVAVEIDEGNRADRHLLCCMPMSLFQ
jgi:Imidazolonepropionase and related amidohydrolases